MRVLFIIAPENFRDEELVHTKELLEGHGAESLIASTKKGTCTGMFGATAEATLTLGEVNVDEYDAIVFVGGAGTPTIRSTEEAITIAQQANEKGKILCAICWAPTILAKAGVLEGKKATVWVGNDPEYGKNTNEVLEQYGATYVAEGVVVDGNLITADGPESAQAFGEAITEALK